MIQWQTCNYVKIEITISRSKITMSTLQEKRSLAATYKIPTIAAKDSSLKVVFSDDKLVVAKY